MSYEVDRYALEQELGRGAFGAVYVARHTILGTRVALKLLHSTQAQEPDAVERFLREARAAASIGSPCEDAPIWLMSCELSCTAGGVCRRSDAQTRGERDVPAVALEEVVEVRDEPEHPDIEASP